MGQGRVSLWLEITGAIGIIASLALVALQIRQNTDALSAQAVLSLNGAYGQTHLLVASDPGFADLLTRAEDGVIPLSPVEMTRIRSWTFSRVRVLESAYQFYKKGIIEEIDYAGWREVTCAMVTHPGEGQVFRRFKTFYNPEFVNYAETSCKRSSP